MHRSRRHEGLLEALVLLLVTSDTLHPEESWSAMIFTALAINNLACSEENSVR